MEESKNQIKLNLDGHKQKWMQLEHDLPLKFEMPKLGLDILKFLNNNISKLNNVNPISF